MTNAGSGPLNGIVLSGTGAGGGPLVVTGVPNGGTGVPGSGGTIDNTTGAGVSVSGSGNVVLNDMVISGSAGDGISASNVPTLNVTGTQITHAGTAGIADGGNGSVAEQNFIINADTIFGQPGAALALNGFQGGAQGAIENSTIGQPATAGSGSSGGDGIDLADTSGQFVVEAQGNTIQEVATGAGINVNALAAAEVDLTLNNANNIQLTGTGSGDGVAINGGAGLTCLNAEDDTITCCGNGPEHLRDVARSGRWDVQHPGPRRRDHHVSGRNLPRVRHEPGQHAERDDGRGARDRLQLRRARRHLPDADRPRHHQLTHGRRGRA